MISHLPQHTLFFPWRDDFLMPEESTYAVVQKLAWFNGVASATCTKSCRRGLVRSAAASVSLSVSTRRPSAVESDEPPPIVIHGSDATSFLRRLYLLECDEIPHRWRAVDLRVCRECLALGIHLRVHQHRAVCRCPVHGTALQRVCRVCAANLSFKLEAAGCSFVCPKCDAPLVEGGSVVRAISDNLRKKYSGAVHEFLEWQAITRLPSVPMAGLDSQHCAIDDCTQHLTSQCLAITTRSARWPPPACVISDRLGPASVRLRTLDLRGSNRPPLHTKAAVYQGGEGVEIDAPPCEASLEPHGKDECATKVAKARVAKMFVRKSAASHHLCLDTPYRLFGERLGSEKADALLGCCPVGVGFWIWRIVISYPWIVEPIAKCCETLGNCRGADLLGFAVLRSLLHYCIQLAADCIDMSESECVQTRLLPIRNLLASKFEWAPILDFGRTPVSTSNQDHSKGTRLVVASYISFQLPDGFFIRPCTAMEPCRRNLAERLCEIRGLPSLDAIDEAWIASQCRHESPFAAMRHDNGLLAIYR